MPASTNGVGAKLPVTAIQAPSGAPARASPSARCAAQVKRLV